MSPAGAKALAWLTRSFPDLPGRWRLLRRLEHGAPVLAALGPQRVRLAGHLRIQVDPRDENGRWVFINGLDRRERLTRHFIRLLRPGDCVIDVGANAGYYTLVAAALVGRAGCVHAFEPSPAVLPALRATARLNPDCRVFIHEVAVSDHEHHGKSVSFHTAAPDRTGYSSVRDLGSATAAVMTVPCIAVDTLLHDLPPVRLVKIDVEGSEYRVLSGMQRLIARDRPYLIVEIDDTFLRQLGADAAAVCALLTRSGYGLHRIVEQGALEPLAEPPVERSNILARPM